MQPNSSVASAEVPDTWAAPALTLAAPVSRTEGLRHWTMPGFVLIIIGLFTVQLQDTIRTDEFIIPGLALLFGSVVGGHSVSVLTRRAIGFGRSIAPESVIAVFLLVGTASTLYVLPFDIGLRNGVVPGVLRTLSQLLLVAILLAAAHSGRGSTWLLTGAVLLTLVEAVSGLLQLNKSVVLLPIVALLAGLGWRYGVRRVILPGFVVLVLS